MSANIESEWPRGPRLTDAGVLRRERILVGLQNVVVSRRRRRRVLRGATLIVPVLAVVLVGWLMPRPATAPGPGRSGEVTIAAAPVPGPSIEMVFTDVGLPKRLAASAGPDHVQRLDDAQLQHLLVEAGEASGIMRIGARVLTERDLLPAQMPGSDE